MWTSDVTIKRCRIKNGDDCTTVKSGSRDILIEDLYCEHGDGLTIGSVWYDEMTPPSSSLGCLGVPLESVASFLCHSMLTTVRYTDDVITFLKGTMTSQTSPTVGS